MQPLSAPTSGGTSVSQTQVGLEHVTKVFGNELAVDSLDLDILDGELLVILGPSGSGKTTILNLLAGLERPTSGLIRFRGVIVNELPPERRDIAMVFQSSVLYPHLDVYHNIEFSFRRSNLPRTEREARVKEMADLLMIGRYLGRRVHQLSGGERQRVAIAKALVRRPDLFLLDEPFSNLDAALRRQMRGELSRVHRQLGTTMVFITHDQEEAMSIADRVVVMNSARLIQLGDPLDVYYHPVNLWVATFIGNHPINQFRGEMRADGIWLAGFEAPLVVPYSQIGFRARGSSSQGLVTVAARPETVRIIPGGTDAGTAGRVESSQVLGSDVLYVVSAGTHSVQAVLPSTQVWTPGDAVKIDFDWSRCLLFDGSGDALYSASVF